MFNVFKWVGNSALITAATCVAISPEWALDAWPFFLYTTGTIVWLIAGTLIKEWALVSLQVFYFVVNLYGIYTRL
jgi:hypothetical protein